MIGKMVILAFFGLHVCAWCTNPAFSQRRIEDVSLVERLRDLKCEMIEAHEQGNDAEVAEIESLMEKLKQTDAELDSEDDMDLRERLEELERELEIARQSGNELEIDEIQELMARLTGKIGRAHV